MQLTHFGHSCLLASFREGDSETTVLFDPGNFSHGFEGVTGLSAILVRDIFMSTPGALPVSKV